MYRCHIDTNRIHSDLIQLKREESRHLKSVLRVKPNADIELFDGAGRTRQAVIQSIDKNSVLIKPSGHCINHPTPECAITLFVCISKGKRMDWTIEKAAELGATQIIPVISSRTIVRLSKRERAGKTERWRRVALDALRQCGGAWQPTIHVPIDFNEALKQIPKNSPVFTAALTDDAIAMRTVLQKIKSPQTQAGWFVGPEGDFTAEELDLLKNAGTTFVSLGKNVLRAETAAVYGLCVLGCAYNACQ